MNKTAGLQPNKIQGLKSTLRIMILTTMPNEGNACIVCRKTTQRQLKESMPILRSVFETAT